LPATTSPHRLSGIMKEVLDAAQIKRAIETLYRAIRDALPEKGTVALIGIRTRGETLARRLSKKLVRDFPEREINLGVLDITFHRDDLSRRKGVPLVKATEIDFDIDDSWVLLVDDVIETGRSIRAAMDVIHSYGRPKVLRLGVLIDRGGRELPIAADFTGKYMEISPKQRIQVWLEENDDCEGAYTIKKK